MSSRFLTRYKDVEPYITKDGSTIRELAHPDHHPVRHQSVAEATIMMGESTQAHNHKFTEEIYYILSGNGTMKLGVEEFAIGEGDTIIIEPGTPHQLTNTGTEELRVLCCCSPPYGHEDTKLIQKHGVFFIHGLESSSKGNKGRWFANHFPAMVIEDYPGSLVARMEKLEKRCSSYEKLTLIGSSFGGLMALKFAIRYPEKCAQLILLAPALNFEGFSPPARKLDIKSTVFIGRFDTVTPADTVVPIVKSCFVEPTITLFDDDHGLSKTFETLDWQGMLKQS